jgi:hypothetical protein
MSRIIQEPLSFCFMDQPPRTVQPDCDPSVTSTVVAILVVTSSHRLASNLRRKRRKRRQLVILRVYPTKETLHPSRGGITETENQHSPY